MSYKSISTNRKLAIMYLNSSPFIGERLVLTLVFSVVYIIINGGLYSQICSHQEWEGSIHEPSKVPSLSLTDRFQIENGFA